MKLWSHLPRVNVPERTLACMRGYTCFHTPTCIWVHIGFLNSAVVFPDSHARTPVYTFECACAHALLLQLPTFQLCCKVVDHKISWKRPHGPPPTKDRDSLPCSSLADFLQWRLKKSPSQEPHLPPFLVGKFHGGGGTPKSTHLCGFRKGKQIQEQ